MPESESAKRPSHYDERDSPVDTASGPFHHEGASQPGTKSLTFSRYSPCGEFCDKTLQECMGRGELPGFESQPAHHFILSHRLFWPRPPVFSPNYVSAVGEPPPQSIPLTYSIHHDHKLTQPYCNDTYIVTSIIESVQENESIIARLLYESC